MLIVVFYSFKLLSECSFRRDNLLAFCIYKLLFIFICKKYKDYFLLYEIFTALYLMSCVMIREILLPPQFSTRVARLREPRVATPSFHVYQPTARSSRRPRAGSPGLHETQ